MRGARARDRAGGLGGLGREQNRPRVPSGAGGAAHSQTEARHRPEVNEPEGPRLSQAAGPKWSR